MTRHIALLDHAPVVSNIRGPWATHEDGELIVWRGPSREIVKLQELGNGSAKHPVSRRPGLLKKDALRASPRPKVPTWACVALFFLLIASCGSITDPSPTHLSICGPATTEERQAVQDVEDALIRLGVSLPSQRVVFIHDPQEIPVGLTVPWVVYRSGDTEPRDPAVGYGGCCTQQYCYVNRCGSKAGCLASLLIHELAHAVGYGHGAKMREFEQRVMDEYREREGK